MQESWLYFSSELHVGGPSSYGSAMTVSKVLHANDPVTISGDTTNERTKEKVGPVIIPSFTLEPLLVETHLKGFVKTDKITYFQKEEGRVLGDCTDNSVQNFSAVAVLTCISQLELLCWKCYGGTPGQAAEEVGHNGKTALEIAEFYLQHV